MDETKGWIGVGLAVGGAVVAVIRWALGLHLRTQRDLAEARAMAAEAKMQAQDAETGVIDLARTVNEAVKSMQENQKEIVRQMGELHEKTNRTERQLSHLEGEHSAMHRLPVHRREVDG